MSLSEKVGLLGSLEVDTTTTTDSATEFDGTPTPITPPPPYYNSIRRSVSRIVTPYHVPRHPASFRRKVRTSFTTGAILLAVVLERVTYFSIVGNLVLFCTNVLQFDSALAVTIDLIFIGICYTVPLVGGRIADLIAGRFNTIYGSFLILVTGVFLLPAVALDYVSKFGYDASGQAYQLPLPYRQGYFVVGIVLCGIGCGGIKANISPLGAQQVEWFGEHAVHSFFNWFYWSITLGGCFAYLFVIYIQQEIGFDVGYLIPALTALGALIVFMLPRNFYREHERGSVVREVLSILWNGTFGGCLRRKKDSNAMSSPSSDESYATPRRWLDHARASCGGDFDDVEVDDVKCTFMTIPVFLTLIIFSSFTSQNTTSMLLQGERMDARTSNGYIIPAASLNFIKMAVITLLIPVLDRIIYPLMDYFDRKPTLLQRIGFGMVIGILAMVVMGIVEIERKHDMDEHGGIAQNVSGVIYNASHVSIAWQTPQFVLSGAAEAFTLVSALEFAYTESPVVTQGMVMGMNHVTTGVGALLASAIYNIVAIVSNQYGVPWLPNEINDGRLEYFSFLLAAIMFLNLVVFILIARNYQYNCLGVAPPMPGTPYDQSTEFPRPNTLPSNGPILVSTEHNSFRNV